MSKQKLLQVYYYFLTYCKARRKGWDEIKNAMLAALHDHDFDVIETPGRLCLVRLNIGLNIPEWTDWKCKEAQQQ